jgi:hypothetical protein
VPDEVVPAAATPDPAVPEARPDERVPDERVPDEAELARTATPGAVRRAPRFGAFIGTGALVGAVLGVILATVLDKGDLAGVDGGVLPFLGGANGARALTALGLAAAGALVGAVLALWADARSLRRR